MSGVQDIFKCPECGHEEAFVEYETRTSCEVALCDNCGYNHRKNYSTGTFQQGKACGAYRVSAARGHSTIGAFRRSRTVAQRTREFARSVRDKKTVFVAFSTRTKGKWDWVILKDQRKRAERLRRLSDLAKGKPIRSYAIYPELADKGLVNGHKPFRTVRKDPVYSSPAACEKFDAEILF